MRLKSAAGAVWLLTFLNGVYLLAFGDPTLAYFLNMLAPLALGVALIVLVAVSWRKAGWLLLSALSVAAIIERGATIGAREVRIHHARTCSLRLP
jgi:hypothetical protein